MIPFNIPYVPEASRAYVEEVLSSEHQQGDGQYTEKASSAISKLVGGGKVLLTPSCTHALEMASMLANLGPDDEVILPAYTFTSAATAITKFGATPVFVDIDPKTKCIETEQVISAITSKTKAISWVNYAGVAPDLTRLKQIAKDYNLILIEDNAHGLGGSFEGKPLGSFGDFATQSFHATKNLQCGEGGALVVNNPDYYERAEVIREKGTNRRKFLAGEVMKYHWVDKGSSYLLAEALSGVLLGQLENFSLIQEHRLRIWNEYNDHFNRYELANNFEIQQQSDHSKNIAHMFHLTFKNKNLREEYRTRLLERGIQATSHYEPLNSSPAGIKFG